MRLFARSSCEQYLNLTGFFFHHFSFILFTFDHDDFYPRLRHSTTCFYDQLFSKTGIGLLSSFIPCPTFLQAADNISVDGGVYQTHNKLQPFPKAVSEDVLCTCVRLGLSLDQTTIRTVFPRKISSNHQASSIPRYVGEEYSLVLEVRSLDEGALLESLDTVRCLFSSLCVNW